MTDLFLAKETASNMASVASIWIHSVVFIRQLLSTEYSSNFTNLYHQRLGILGHRLCNGLHFRIFKVKNKKKLTKSSRNLDETMRFDHDQMQKKNVLLITIYVSVSSPIQLIGNDVCTTNSPATTRTNSRYVCCCYAYHGHI